MTSKYLQMAERNQARFQRYFDKGIGETTFGDRTKYLIAALALKLPEHTVQDIIKTAEEIQGKEKS